MCCNAGLINTRLKLAGTKRLAKHAVTALMEPTLSVSNIIIAELYSKGEMRKAILAKVRDWRGDKNDN